MKRPAPSWMWPALGAVCAALAMRDAFTASAVFHTRDLSFFYWPHHLWLRSNLRAGTFPLWDPHVGLGQSAIADPIRQMLFPPTLVLRLLPAEIGFNLMVALPILLASLGTYLFLRRHASPPAAALGGIVFSLSGPVLSTANSPNMAWSLAFTPAALAAVDSLALRPGPRRLTVLALLFGLQALAGETVILIGTIALAVAYAASAAGPGSTARRDRVRLVILTAAAWALGILLAAPQLLPVLRAARLSGRATGMLPGVHSLHPLSLIETVAWPLFGDWFEPWGVDDPWVTGLYGLYISVYVGAAALAVALLGVLAPGRSRWRVFWCVVGLVSLALALGRFTPVHGAFLTVFPLARSFRYPAKYAIFTVLALGALAATGWESVASAEGRRRRALAVAAAGALTLASLALIALAVLSFRPSETMAALTRLAEAAGAAPAAAAAGYLAASLRAALPRTAVVAALGAGCLWMTRTRADAKWVLYGVLVADLLVVNGRLNPSADAGLFGEPPWVGATRSHAGDRTYIGGRVSWLFDLEDPDDPGRRADPPREAQRSLVSSLYAALFATFPSPWGVRECTSANLSALWPAEYSEMMRDFVNAGREERTRFLRRAGVRYFVMPVAPAPQARPLLRLRGFGDTALYEVTDPAPRASMVGSHKVIPAVAAQTRLMFDRDFDPSREVLLEAEPGPPAGVAAPSRDPVARIEKDGPDELRVRVAAGEGGGFHVLLDSYDGEWDAEVDGRPAQALRANGVFRAVRVASGEHEVRWVYRPRTLRTGAVLAGAAGLVLLAGNFFLERRPGRQ